MKFFIPFNEKREYIGDAGSVGLQTEQNVIVGEKLRVSVRFEFFTACAETQKCYISLFSPPFPFPRSPPHF